MKIVCLSDTHNLHRHYGHEPFGDVPEGDMVIHAGDITTHGTPEEANQFSQWFRRLPHRHKIFIAGNHDRCMPGVAPFHLDGVTYLFNSGCEFDGVKIWGSPFTPRHQDFAFQLDSDLEAAALWSSIPDDTDILVTHGPPQGILDQGAHAGCPELLRRVERLRPRLHVFGHDHDAHGRFDFNGTIFLNASVHSWLWKQTRPMPCHVIGL